MIQKFSHRSDRVKGISFHPNRPWLLTGLHTGTIELWDYRLQQVIHQFQEHEGPVRSVQFHHSLSLFASGGDDFTVRVWNYKTKKCQFVLKGHLDYVRSVNFHPDQPWVLSSSDDQTARIWNYQSRQMIAILTGHSHYVMHAEFHPSKDLIVTCSLDMSARLWNYSTLRQRQSRRQDFAISGAEVTLIAIMEGHKDQINWCSFHPKDNYILTSADDHKIKLWKYTDTKCSEIETFTGHTGNVSCVIFHPKDEIFISNSEDKTTRVWDFNKKTLVDTFTNKEFDRFWIVSAHPDNYYFASGSDSFLYVFNLFKDRIPMVKVTDNYICHGFKKSLKVIDLKSGSSTTIKEYEVGDNILQDNITKVLYNVYDTIRTQILVKLGQTKYSLLFNNQQKEMFNSKCAIFVGKNKLVRLNENSIMELYNYEQNQTNILCVTENVVSLFMVHGGKLLGQTVSNQIILVDPQAKKVTDRCDEGNKIKDVVQNQQFIAIMFKKQINIYTKTLHKIISIDERINIKSLIWHESFLLYTTKAQLKFLLLNGDTGVIKSTENIIYLAKAMAIGDNNFNIIGMDNRGELADFPVNLSEVVFKQALYDKNIPLIQKYIGQLQDAQVAYLYKKNYTSLAINMVSDKTAKFSLAIDASNLEIAYKMCNEIKKPYAYQALKEEAQRQGNHNIVEICNQQLQNYNSLIFHYMIQGNQDKLNKLTAVDPFSVAIYTGNIEARIKLLQESGQLSLAYMSAIAHGLQDLAQEIRTLIKKDQPHLLKNLDMNWLKNRQPVALLPPPLIIKGNSNIVNMNWPHNYIDQQKILDLQADDDSKKLLQEIEKTAQKSDVLIQNLNFNAQSQPKQDEVEEPEVDDENDAKWGLEDENLLNEEEQQPTQQSVGTQLNVSAKDLDLTFAQSGLSKFITNQSKLSSLYYLFQAIQTSTVAGDHLAVGNYVEAKKLLGKIDVEVAKQILLTQKQLITQIPYLQAAPLHVLQDNSITILSPSLSEVRLLVKQGHKTTTEGKFAETLQCFAKIRENIPYLKAENENEKEEIQKILSQSINYCLAMKCELKKKTESAARQLELGCYMACFNLQPNHRVLTLRSAMSLAYKQKNFITCNE